MLRRRFPAGLAKLMMGTTAQPHAMTGYTQISLDKSRQGRILAAVIGLHAVVLYGLLVYRPPHLAHNAETRVDLIWLKPPAPSIIVPAPAPAPNRPTAGIPRPGNSPAMPQQAPPRPAPDGTPQPESSDRKPLDLQKVLSDVGPAIRKLDSEDPTGQALRGEPQPPTFEAKLAKVLANAKSAPKFYEGARIETISSGTELDAGILKYKITTFLGSYCVTYKDGAQVYVGTCPIKF